MKKERYGRNNDKERKNKKAQKEREYKLLGIEYLRVRVVKQKSF